MTDGGSDNGRGRPKLHHFYFCSQKISISSSIVTIRRFNGIKKYKTTNLKTHRLV